MVAPIASQQGILLPNHASQKDELFHVAAIFERDGVVEEATALLRWTTDEEKILFRDGHRPALRCQLMPGCDRAPVQFDEPVAMRIDGCTQLPLRLGLPGDSNQIPIAVEANAVARVARLERAERRGVKEGLE